MRKILVLFVSAAVSLALSFKTDACTNVIVTPGASADGSSMVSYAADSHVLFGELYFWPAADWKAGSMLRVTDWDGNFYRGDISQTSHTYQVTGNMNEKQLVIAETTWGGREEQVDPKGIMDYGSLIYVTLQRASTARQAIETIVALANEYGYPSEGETFSIADKNEAWIMDLVGKGKDEKGIVWVARRIPDGYVCSHANQARITRFPLNDPNTLYAPDVISYARKKGWYDGPDSEFSFRDAYCPVDFSMIRGCDSRVWSAFNILCKGIFSWEENGVQKMRKADDYLEYAMGYDLQGELPLWVKPNRKITPKMVADVMRDHFEDTPMDMRKDIGAGGDECPYRWRPMDFEWEGKKYVNERAIATQQTGFWFVAQCRPSLPDVVGALLWFGVDDAATSYLTPVYVNINEVPDCLRQGNGSMLEYSASSSFWINNRITNHCYLRYRLIEPEIRSRIDAFETRQMFEAVPAMDAGMMALYGEKAGKGAVRKIRKSLTEYTVNTAQKQFESWVELEKTLIVKYIDGNVKNQGPDGALELSQPGYSDKWKEVVVKDHGLIIQYPEK